MANFIGIDIGGTKIAGAVVSHDGQVFNRQERPTPVREGGNAILAEAIDLAGRLIQEAQPGDEQIIAIGIGAGGQIDAEQGLVFSATEVLPGWKGTKITEAFEAAWHLPCKVDNDVNVLALGECRFGAARHLSNSATNSGTIVFLALGTGVGGALINRGLVHHGAHWSGGEFGHILLSMAPDARLDTGGAQGTLEAYCSGPGMVETYKELIRLSDLSDLSDDNIDGHDVVAAANLEKAQGLIAGPGQRAVALTGQYLGFGLTTLANALDPDLIIIGGGVAALGEDLLGPARSVLRARALPGPSACPVVVAELGVDAAVVGAACLVIPAVVPTYVYNNSGRYNYSGGQHE
jgi:glucokinase